MGFSLFDDDMFSSIEFTAPAGTDTTKDDKNLVDKIADVVDDAENILDSGLGFLDSLGINIGGSTKEEIQKDLDRDTNSFLDGFFESDTFGKVTGAIKREFLPITIIFGLLLGVLVLRSFRK